MKYCFRCDKLKEDNGEDLCDSCQLYFREREEKELIEKGVQKTLK